MSKILALCLMVAACTQACAAGVLAGKVITVRVDEDGRGVVTFDAAATGTPPACVTASYRASLAFNLADPGGKGVLAMALAAKALGTPVVAYGTGNCNTYSAVMEDWSYGVAN